VETETLVAGSGLGLAGQAGTFDCDYAFAVRIVRVAASRQPSEGGKGSWRLSLAGPPFRNSVFNQDKARPWGLTNIPLSYDPPIKSAEELKPKSRTERRRSRLDVLLETGRPAPATAESRGYPDHDRNCGSVVPCVLRSLHLEIFDAGRCENTLMRLGEMKEFTGMDIW